MSEKDLRKQILIPLLQAMQFQGVHEYHGATEFGKDIVCWKSDELNNRDNLALVVKAVAVSGKSNASADIENQVRQCFSKPYIDPITGSEEQVHRCWIVSNKPISHEAISLIKAGIGHAVYENNVTFIDIDALWRLIEKHMPFQASLQKLEDVRQDCETWDTHYRLETRIDGTGIHHTVAEKFPGAALEKPLTFKPKFAFPDTEDGKKHEQALQRFFDTGASINIPATYIKDVEYPDILKGMFPAMTEDGFLQLTSQPTSKPLLLHCEICCDDGERFVIDHIHFTCTQVGRKEALLTNEAQLLPFKLQLTLHADGSISNLQMSMNTDISLNAHQRFLQMQLMRSLSKPHRMRFTNLETGLLVASNRNETGVSAPPDEQSFEVLAALDTLQRKTGRLVYLPDRDLTDEERQDIDILCILFRTGKLRMTWENAFASTIITDENREEQTRSLRQAAEGNAFYYLEQEEKLCLFGEEYLLGPIKPLSLPIKLANWTEIKALLDEGFCGEVRLEFVLRDNDFFTKEYVNWLPERTDMPIPADDTGSSQ